MNAYELAKELNACFTKADWEYVDEAVNMLRQQADRIEKLESYLKASQESRIEDGKYQADRIAELEKDAEYYKHHYLELVGNYQDLLLKEKFETPQTKPLIDEEIEYITKQWFNCRSDTKLTEQFVMPLYSVVDLCKKILKQTNKK